VVQVLRSVVTMSIKALCFPLANFSPTCQKALYWYHDRADTTRSFPMLGQLIPCEFFSSEMQRKPVSGNETVIVPKLYSILWGDANILQRYLIHVHQS
jgi:hypothetical protein